MKRITFFATLCVVCALAQAADDGLNKAINAYIGSANYGTYSCGLSFRSANARTVGGLPQDEKSDWRGCIVKQKADLKMAYEAIYQLLEKPGAQASLKEHYIATLNALNGIEPGLDETKAAYGNRQAVSLEKMSQQWARFEIDR